jgi:hypothetical protein
MTLRAAMGNHRRFFFAHKEARVAGRLGCCLVGSHPLDGGDPQRVQGVLEHAPGQLAQAQA